jgi:hypothetical protein
MLHSAYLSRIGERKTRNNSGRRIMAEESWRLVTITAYGELVGRLKIKCLSGGVGHSSGVNSTRSFIRGRWPRMSCFSSRLFSILLCPKCLYFSQRTTTLPCLGNFP